MKSITKEQEEKWLKCEHRQEWLQPDPSGIYCSNCEGISQYDIYKSITHWQWEMGKDDKGDEWFFHYSIPDVPIK